MNVQLFLFISLLVFVFSCKTNKKIIDSTLHDGLVAYYPFKGNANDASGNGNNGNVHGAQLTSDRNGNTNNAYYFDGNNSYIDLGNSALIKRYRSDYSISFWLNLNSFSSSYCSVIISNRNTSNYSGSMIEIAGNLSIQNKQVIFYKNYKVTSDTTTADFLNSINTINLGKWYHICLTYKYNGGFENIVKIYIDGQLTSAKKMSSPINPGSGNTFVGNEPELYPDYSLNGSLDEIRFYNRVLFDFEIGELSRL